MVKVDFDTRKVHEVIVEIENCFIPNDGMSANELKVKCQVNTFKNADGNPMVMINHIKK